MKAVPPVFVFFLTASSFSGLTSGSVAAAGHEARERIAAIRMRMPDARFGMLKENMTRIY